LLLAATTGILVTARASMEKILIVEDEPLLREALQDWLGDSGYDVCAAASGEEALEAAGRDRFHVVVLDLRLPGLDGLQTWERLRELEPEPRGILITAYPSRETQERARRLRMHGYLIKPFRIEELERAIKEALRDASSAQGAREQMRPGRAAVSYRLCDMRYECARCAFAQDVEDRFGVTAAIGEDQVSRLMLLPGNQRQCRFAWAHSVRKEMAGSGRAT
jgi:DNA-binding response OmpR family regulator